MNTIPQAPASAEVEVEAWLRAVLHLRARGLEPVVPVRVAWALYEAYGVRVHGPVELWERAA